MGADGEGSGDPANTEAVSHKPPNSSPALQGDSKVERAVEADGSTEKARKPDWLAGIPFFDPTTGEKLSNRKRKRMRRDQLYIERRKIKRKAEKVRRKERERREKEEQEAEDKRRLESGEITQKDIDERRRKNYEKLRYKYRSREEYLEVVQNAPTVVIDLSFHDFMNKREVGSLTRQCQFLYAANVRARQPLDVLFTSLDGPIEQALTTKMAGFDAWNIRKSKQHYLQLLRGAPSDAKEESGGVHDAKDTPSSRKIIYLSSESPNVLQELDKDAVYVIGGIVDRNRHKGLCHKLAEEAGVSHARLPIAEHLSMATRTVITVNQVFHLLLERFQQGGNWTRALEIVMPQRKNYSIKAEAAAVSTTTADAKVNTEPVHSKE